MSYRILEVSQPRMISLRIKNKHMRKLETSNLGFRVRVRVRIIVVRVRVGLGLGI